MPPALPAPHDPREHPAWCDLPRCTGDADAHGALHVSAPIEWQASAGDDAQLSLARYRLDFDNHEQVEGWLLTLRHHGNDEHASAMLTDHDLDMVAVARMQLRTEIMPKVWGTRGGIARLGE